MLRPRCWEQPISDVSARASYQYAADHGEVLPSGQPAAALGRYASAEVFNCPAGARYIFNPAVAGKTLNSVATPAETPLILETNDGRTIADVHDLGANIGYVDGHVKWGPAGSGAMPSGP